MRCSNSIFFFFALFRLILSVNLYFYLVIFKVINDCINIKMIFFVKLLYICSFNPTRITINIDSFVIFCSKESYITRNSLKFPMLVSFHVAYNEIPLLTDYYNEISQRKLFVETTTQWNKTVARIRDKRKIVST